MAFVNQVQDFVSDFINGKLSNAYSYHNLDHTVGVVKAVESLCNEEKVAPLDKEMLLVAAWFHDTGYTKACKNHEDFSVEIAARFLKEKEKSDDYIATVSSLIKATAKEYVPQTLFEKIIKDADFHHILDDNYIFSCEGLRK